MQRMMPEDGISPSTDCLRIHLREKLWIMSEAGRSQNGILRAIGTPGERFAEDVRLIRAVRFATRTGFDITSSTWDALREDAALLAKVSPERIRDEFDKIITDPSRRRGIELLVAGGLMDSIIPEFLSLQGCEQSPQFHPEGDVYIHTLLMLELLDDDAPLALVLSVLDIAKPLTLLSTKTGV